MKRLVNAGVLRRVNSEVWVVLSLLTIALLLDRLFASPRTVLAFYVFPTIASAYLWGRRHGMLTALASVLLVVGVSLFRSGASSRSLTSLDWLEVAVWGGSLVVTGYLLGTLYEHRSRQIEELRDTYEGVLMILRHFAAKDAASESHCTRVALYASKIAEQLHLAPHRIEDIRAAALLHDMGQLTASRDVLYRAARLTPVDHDDPGEPDAGERLDTAGGALRRVIPILLAHHDGLDGVGYGSAAAMPLEARIIAVADVYDALTSEKPYRKALSSFEAGELITNRQHAEFDPEVVAAFETALKRGDLVAPLLAA